jgi:hypothetical protein
MFTTPEVVNAEVAYRTERAKELYRPRKSKAARPERRPGRRLARLSLFVARTTSHA